jgi:class 3 adenylate cyclase
VNEKVLSITDRLRNANIGSGAALPSDDDRTAAESFIEKHSTKMLVILFTDIVGSTALKAALGDKAEKSLEDEHKRLLITAFNGIENARLLRSEGDSYIFLFLKPGDAVRFAIRAQALHRKARSHGCPSLPEFRAGIHMGEVIVEERGNRLDIKGLQADTAARIMGLANGGQILCSRSVFDDARQSLKSTEPDEIGPLSWQSHGFYMLKGREDPFEICEIREAGGASFGKPEGSEKAKPADRLPKKKTRFIYFALPVLLVIIAAILMLPNIRHLKSQAENLLREETKPSPAEVAIDKLKYEVIGLHSKFESIDDYGGPAEQEVRKAAPGLARQILNLNEKDMDAQHRILKYQFGTHALVMAASVESDKTESVSYADQGILTGEKGLAVIEASLEQASRGGEKEQELYNWIVSNRRQELMQYLVAILWAIKTRLGDETAAEQTEKYIAMIPASYKERYPLETEPNLNWFLSEYSDAPSPDPGKQDIEKPPSSNSGDFFNPDNMIPDDEVGTYRALVIGINEYDDRNIPSLINARNDAKAVAEILEERYRFQEVNLLLDGEATKKAIYDAMRELIRVAGSGDSVLIYYSGHGEIDVHSKTKKDGWWLPRDAVSGDTFTYLENSMVRTVISNMKARHVLLISDSCYAGTLFGQTRSIPPIGERLYRELYERQSRWGMTSGNKHPVSDVGAGGHSVFASQLLKVLKGNRQPYLSTQEIFNRIRYVVSNNSEQTPICRPLQNTGDEGGEFVFILKIIEN